MTIDDYKVFVKNVTLSDAEWQILLEQVVADIANETRIFKKMVGFTVEPTVEYYDFQAITSLHDKLTFDIYNITIGSFTFDDIMSISKGCVPSLTTTAAGVYSNLGNMILDVHDIIATDTRSLFKDFRYVQGYTYRNMNYDPCANVCEVDTSVEDCVQKGDEAFIVDDAKKAIAIVSFEPDLSAIPPELERRIKPAIIAGLKFFGNDIYNDQENAAVANLFYQRYFAAKRELINKYPAYGTSNKRDVSEKYV